MSIFKVNTNLRAQNWYYVALLVGVLVVYITNLVLSSQQSNKKIFPNTIGNLSRKYSNDITPANWVFGIIWTIIYAWQIAWIIYAFVCLFRRVKSKDAEIDKCLIYRITDFIFYAGLVAFGLNVILTIGWLFAWTNECIALSFILLLTPTIALYASLYFFLTRFDKNYSTMIKLNLQVDIWLARILLHNGLATYITWMSLATNLNLTTMLIYEAGLETSCAGTIALTSISILILIYFVLENFIWPRYLLYVFTPWFVLIFALVGSIIKNWKTPTPSTNNIFSLCMLCVAILLFLAKLVMFVLYHTKLKHRIQRNDLQAQQAKASEQELQKLND